MLNNLLKVIKNNPIKIIMVGILLLNCFGFCWREFRFLSDQERIEIAVQKALNFYGKKQSNTGMRMGKQMNLLMKITVTKESLIKYHSKI